VLRNHASQKDPALRVDLSFRRRRRVESASGRQVGAD
jgi:hypothetical protein